MAKAKTKARAEPDGGSIWDDLKKWVLGILASALVYAVITSWKNSEALSRIERDTTALRQTLSAFILKDHPEAQALIGKMFTDAGAAKGATLFRAGDYDAAFAAWRESADSGSQQAMMLASAGLADLRERAGDTSLGQADREKAIAALKNSSIWTWAADPSREQPKDEGARNLRFEPMQDDLQRPEHGD